MVGLTPVGGGLGVLIETPDFGYGVEFLDQGMGISGIMTVILKLITLMLYLFLTPTKMIFLI